MAISSFGKIQGKLTKQDVQRAAAKVCDCHIVWVVRSRRAILIPINQIFLPTLLDNIVVQSFHRLNSLP
jgi:hypothetical protein